MIRDVSKYVQGRIDQATAANGDQELIGLWGRLRDLYDQKLWHQATEVLDKLVRRPELTASLMELYENVVADFETKLQPLRLVNLCIPIVQSVKTLEEATTFLDRVSGKVKGSAEAEALVMVTKVVQSLSRDQQGQMGAVKGMLEEIDAKLEEVDRVGQVHKEFYRVASEYHKLRGDHSNYYQSCLRFLGCSQLDDQTDEENRQLAFFLALAALLGEDIFNFGELLAHPVVKFLENSNEYKWLVPLLSAFNSGNIAEYNRLKPQWSTQADLKAKETALYEKLCLLALLNMSFECSATKRQLDFSAIAERTGLAINVIELMVMKALSRGLIRGQIDQVSQTVHVSWVRPRVLDRSQLGSLVKKIDDWTESIKQMEILIENNASDILTA